jgi:hypothetical protein
MVKLYLICNKNLLVLTKRVNVKFGLIKITFKQIFKFLIII